MDLDVWACPVCRSDLVPSPRGMVCRLANHSFSRRDGLDVLVRPEQEADLERATAFAEVWKKFPWSVPREGISRLPYVRQPGWRQKARSLEALRAILGPSAGRKVADVGAGTGWLSHRLTEAGFRCYATDLSADSQVGLGAATAFGSMPHSFQRAIATLECWPFQSASMDVAICNASLHYLKGVEVALTEAVRVLRPGGVFVEMNSPVHRDERSARRAARCFQERVAASRVSRPFLTGHRHFVESDLEGSLRRTFSSVRRHDPAYGLWFHFARVLRSRILRMELASFPIYEAHVPGP
jgi:SAM-dependent methyltransferase